MENANVTNEARVLFLCSRVNISNEDKEILQKLITKEIDWQKVKTLATSHKITSLLYKNLSLVNCQEKELMEDIGKYYSFTSERNNSLYKSFRHIVSELNKKNIKAILYKGLVLTKLVYIDLGLRPVGDIDIMVQPKDWPETENVLKENNYAIEIGPLPAYSLPARDWPQAKNSLKDDYGSVDIDISMLNLLARDNFHFHLPYSSQTKEVTHFRGITYYNPTNIDPVLKIFEFDFYKDSSQETWRDALDFSVDGAKGLILSYEDTIIGASMGLNKYNYCHLLQYCDLNELILRFNKDIDWEKLVRKSRE